MYVEDEINTWQTGATPLAQVGLLPSLQGDCLVGEDPSAQTQLGLVLSPHGFLLGLHMFNFL